MTTAQLTGKILITLSTVMYGFVPPLVDLNRTHATNPLWISHARFHVVWQVISLFFLSLLGLYLTWFSKIEPVFSFNLAVIFGVIVLGSFLISVVTKKLYKGTLSDPNGVPPIFKTVDSNLFFFSIAFLILMAGYFIFQIN